MNSTMKESMRPPNVGASHNLPEEIRSRLGSSTTVLAWTALDDAFEPTIGRTACCALFGPLLVLPCFWPHLILCCPCLCMAKSAAEWTMRNTYWILTNSDLKIFTRGYDLGACYKNGDTLKSIPLNHITDCGIQAPTQGCCGNSIKSVPSIYVDTASSGSGETGGTRHEAVGYGLAGYDWFATAILQQRDQLQGRVTVATQVIAAPMERGEPEMVERRMQNIADLRERGIITKEEYEAKRQEIIASI